MKTPDEQFDYLMGQVVGFINPDLSAEDQAYEEIETALLLLVKEHGGEPGTEFYWRLRPAQARIAFISDDWESYDTAISDGWIPDGSNDVDGVEVRYLLLPEEYEELSRNLLDHKADQDFESLLREHLAKVKERQS